MTVITPDERSLWQWGHAEATLRMSILLGPKPRLVKDQDEAAARMARALLASEQDQAAAAACYICAVDYSAWTSRRRGKPTVEDLKRAIELVRGLLVGVQPGFYPEPFARLVRAGALLEAQWIWKDPRWLQRARGTVSDA